ncbi:MAG: purine-binding chemotaxis protein CheW [Provencibacterium sp.]|jgi:purine-binding chemotaxis protein CheW|nr:purine-binding chemotaxis protein CheW [Provencibacterium sp.]
MAEMITNGVQDDLNGKYMTFYIEDTVYGIELFHVMEIIQVVAITPVPNVPDYISGIINLRGKIVPVINVRVKFGQPAKEFDDKTCIIVIEIEGFRVGLIVDGVSEVATISNGQLADPPEHVASGGQQYLQSIANVGGRVILNIDCNRFFQSDLIAAGSFER